MSLGLQIEFLVCRFGPKCVSMRTGARDGNPVSRPPLCNPDDLQASAAFGPGHPLPRPGHRGQHHDLQPHECPFAAVATRDRARSAPGDLHPRQEEPRIQPALAPQLEGLSPGCRSLRRDSRLRLREHEPEYGGRARGRDRPARLRELLRPPGHSRRARPDLRAQGGRGPGARSRGGAERMASGPRNLVGILRSWATPSS